MLIYDHHMPFRREAQEPDPHQRRRREIEHDVRLFAARAHDGGVFVLHPHVRSVFDRHVDRTLIERNLDNISVCHDEAASKDFVTRDEGTKRVPNGFDIDGTDNPSRRHEVVTRRAALEPIEQPQAVLRRRERQPQAIPGRARNAVRGTG